MQPRKNPSRAVAVAALAIASLAMASCAGSGEESQAEARAILCRAGNDWYGANAEVRGATRPAVQRLVNEYRSNSDESIRHLANALSSMLDAGESMSAATAAALRQQCGDTHR